MPETIYLIDGTNYIFRAYYAIRHLSTSRGFPTNAIYGFTTMLLKLLREEKPTHLAIVFDSGKPSFREEIYPQYKANREEPPDDLIQQFPHIPRVVRAMNIPTISMDGVEADDVIGFIAKKAEAAGYKVIIATGDKDFMQLVNDNISLLDEMKEKRIGYKEVVEKFGVGPESVTDIIGLAGDTSDNIPGITGIGPKTATKLIQQFGSLEELVENADKLEGGLKDKIREGVKNAELSKRLATIHTGIKLDIDLKDLTARSPDQDALREILKEFEFSTLLSELTPKAGISRDKYKLITIAADLDALCRTLEKSERISFDTETTSLDPYRAELVGLSFSWAPGEAAYIPVGHTGLDAANQLPRDEVLKKLRPIFETGTKKIGQNCKYDMGVLAKYDITVAPVECDTMIASYVLNPAGPHNLDDMAQQHLDHTTIKYKELTGSGKKEINFSEVDIERACIYSGEDADVTLRLYDIFMREIRGGQFEKLFFEMEMPLMHVLLKMELAGVKVDVELLKKMGETFDTDLKKLERQIHKEAGEEFNINSPKQLGHILFEKLQISGGRKTKTGYSTDVDVLTNLAVHHKLPELVLEYRSISKLKNTYIASLPQLINPKTGRIHTDYNQTVAETGRLSSSDPNLQNIPVRTEAGKRIREAFIAEDGFVLLAADYSQIELRILAHITEEPALIEAFKKGVDVHAVTASGIFGVPPEKVTPEQRAVGKTVNFATIYGQSAFGLSKQLKIGIAVAQEYIDNYFKRYPCVMKYRSHAIGDAKKSGFVETLFGRRRYVPDINSKNGGIRQNAERMAFNTIFQGTAADIIKRAMIEIDRGLAAISPKARMIMQVHDELVFEVPDADAEKVRKFVAAAMEDAASLNVPLVMDTGIGKNWMTI
ncbi:MAG: DNA polymerase I [Deltaproteobacteria bacterium RIFCSPLOWO2_02_FULL_47_10]|nr:MAG: DNA polymerase I [Deltaproteobacteria bacterium RIFCSPLOWO2_02_FULL_47_10]